MKQLKLSLAATILTLALSISAFAGDMPCGIASEQPGQPAMASNTETTPTSGVVSETTAIDPVTEAALNLIQSLLSLF